MKIIAFFICHICHITLCCSQQAANFCHSQLSEDADNSNSLSNTSNFYLAHLPHLAFSLIHVQRILITVFKFSPSFNSSPSTSTTTVLPPSDSFLILKTLMPSCHLRTPPITFGLGSPSSLLLPIAQNSSACPVVGTPLHFHLINCPFHVDSPTASCSLSKAAFSASKS